MALLGVRSPQRRLEPIALGTHHLELVCARPQATMGRLQLLIEVVQLFLDSRREPALCRGWKLIFEHPKSPCQVGTLCTAGAQLALQGVGMRPGTLQLDSQGIPLLRHLGDRALGGVQVDQTGCEGVRATSIGHGLLESEAPSPLFTVGSSGGAFQTSATQATEDVVLITAFVKARSPRPRRLGVWSGLPDGKALRLEHQSPKSRRDRLLVPCLSTGLRVHTSIETGNNDGLGPDGRYRGQTPKHIVAHWHLDPEASRMNHLPLSLDDLQLLLRRLLQEPGQVPDDWEPQATTYDLPRFCGEDTFLERFHVAARQILAGEDARTALYACGIPYDYARLGSPFSTVYELYLRTLTTADRVVSFASRTKAFLAPLEVPGRTQPARVYCRGTLPLSEGTRAMWSGRQVEFHDDWTGPLPADDPSTLTLFVADTAPENTPLADLSADAVSCPITDGGVLLIRRGDRFDAKGIQLIRKRTVAALLAVSARAELCRLVGVDVPASPSATNAECDAALAKSLPAVQGAAYFCTGLAAESAVFGAAAELVSIGKPVPLFYAENGYGGTGQLIYDILSADGVIAATPLKVLGTDGETFVDHVIAALEASSGGPAVVFVETPTNPELQVHDFACLVDGLKRYHARTGQQIPVLVDTTMAPLYPLFEMDFAQDWPFLIVKSGSKYITRGKATMGLVLAGGHPLAQRILDTTRTRGQEADSFAKPYQLAALVQGVTDLRPRMAQISANTQLLTRQILDQLASRGHAITLYTMSPEQIDAGLHSGVVSFYLPAAPTTYPDLVDEFVDWLLEKAPGLVKNRVSYGQSTGNGQPDPFYVINPEESTQGALSAEVKEAQKRGGVQICRISVPQYADVAALVEVMSGFFDHAYGKPTA